jgi:hypothetical protein
LSTIQQNEDVFYQMEVCEKHQYWLVTHHHFGILCDAVTMILNNFLCSRHHKLTASSTMFFYWYRCLFPFPNILLFRS